MIVRQEDRWGEARALLLDFVPGAADFIPDNIAEVLRGQGRTVAWERLAAFGRADDAAVWSEICEHLPALEEHGKAALICDACYLNERSPVILPWCEMHEHVPDLGLELHDEVFGGDVVLLTADTLVLVHHEGQFATVSRSQSPRSSQSPRP